MAWTSKPEWTATPTVEQLLKANKDYIEQYTDVYGTEINPVAIGVKEYKNKVPTHDPYTNPNSHIYYQCDCGAILDPGTRSFAQLNNVASETGWKVRWRQCGDGYQPFCVKCGEDVE